MITDLDTDLHHIFYRNDPPGKSISFATEELLRLCEKYPLGLPMTDLSTKDLTIHEQRTRQKFLQSEIQRCRCVMCPNFDNHVSFYRDSSFFWPDLIYVFLDNGDTFATCQQVATNLSISSIVGRISAQFLHNRAFCV